MRVLSFLLALALAALLSLAVWYWPNRPFPMPFASDMAFSSMSFAPYYRGQSPLRKVYPTVAQIDADMRRLIGKTKALRTYTSLEGMEAVPRLADQHGLKVTHGAWLSSRPLTNAHEISALIDAANRYPDTITRVIVGNEVLLRGELPPEELARFIRRVKSSIKQPVSYADVWEKWIENPELAAEVDFITVHLLPYWENEPVGVERVRQHIADVYQIVRDRFPDKPIMIGEIGWPSAGRMRDDARPGRVEQVQFLKIAVDLAAEKGFDYNIIEAFDQQWKSYQEGTVGANWGIFSIDRALKYPADQAVTEDPIWLPKWGLATVLAAISLAWFLRRHPTGAVLPAIAFALTAQAVWSAVVFGTGVNIAHSYYWLRIAGTVFYAVLTLIFALYFLAGVGSALSGKPPVPDRLRRAGGTLATAAKRGLRGTLSRPNLTLQMLFLIYTGLAIWHTAAIVIDGRYRDFPIGDFLLPAGVLMAWKIGTAFTGRAPAPNALAHALSFGRLFGRPGGEAHSGMAPAYSRWGPLRLELVIVLLLVLGAVGIVIREGWLNDQALMWAGLVLLMAVPYLATMRLSLAMPLAERPPESFTGKW